MPIPTPLYPRTAPLAEGQVWRDWSGYFAAGLYEPGHEREYYAIRNSAGLLDVSPLFKYHVSGPDAERLVNRVMTRNIAKCAVGQVMYSPWCDDEGKVIDDGTISRLEPNHFRLTSADPNLRWFQDAGFGMDATVSDVSTEIAALALQGPKSRAILQAVVSGANLNSLRYFHLTQAQIDNCPVTITRTGYTGDLGYELWFSPQDAVQIWDILLERGADYNILPAGILALDVARIEAGLVMIEVDYKSVHHSYIEAQKSSPFEIGLGWAVSLKKDNFIGRKALLAEKEAGSSWQFVGLEVDWPSLEALYTSAGLAPQSSAQASRDPAPIYQNGQQIGQATSHTFSPLLKKYIAIGTVHSPYAQPGTDVELEFTVEFKRQTAKATVVKLPFFNPSRKRE